jgi:integrase
MAKVLTQKIVDGLKPEAKQYARRDGLVPGHFVIVQPTGHKSYSLFVRINRKQVKLHVGNAAVMTLQQACAEARRLLGLIAQGIDPRTAKQEAAPETFGVVMTRFVERYARPRNRSWRETERVLTREALRRWQHRPIAAITRADVIGLIDAIVDRNSPIAANRALAAVRKLFNWCVERGILETSPAAQVKAPSPETQRDRTHTDAELALIYPAVAAFGYPFGPAIQLMILTGARRSEVAGMRWDEIDPTFSVWVIPKERSKNKIAHVVPLSSAARAILASLPRIGDYVFTVSGLKPVSGFSKVKARLDAAITAANDDTPIPPWILHDFRRTAASGMAKLGISLPVIEKVLNHVSGAFRGVAGIYQRHDFAAEKAEALEAWGRHVMTLVGPTKRRAPRNGTVRRNGLLEVRS